MNNVAFRIPSAKLTVYFYGKSLENVKFVPNRNPPTRLHYSCLAEEI